MKPSISVVVGGALAGKSIGRILFNEEVRTCCAKLSGRVLDIAGGATPSYLAHLPQGIDLVRTDLKPAPGIAMLDMNAPFPFPDASFDAVLCFNSLYIADEPSALAREIYRVLKPQGKCFISSPFIGNEMPEPHDYRRFTAEGLERLFHGTGFSSIEIRRMGERGSAAMALLSPFCVFNAVRACFYPLALLLDRMVPHKVRRGHPAPLGYFCVMER